MYSIFGVFEGSEICIIFAMNKSNYPQVIKFVLIFMYVEKYSIGYNASIHE